MSRPRYPLAGRRLAKKNSAYPQNYPQASLADFEQAKATWLSSHPNATPAEREAALRRIAMDHGQAVSAGANEL